MADIDRQDDQLSAYLDGALPDAERRAVEQSLARDPSARALLDALRSNRALLSGLPRERAPAGLADVVRQRLERQVLLDDAPHEPLARIHPFWRGISYAAIIALTVTVGLVSYRSTVSTSHLPPTEQLADAGAGSKFNKQLPTIAALKKDSRETPAATPPPVLARKNAEPGARQESNRLRALGYLSSESPTRAGSGGASSQPTAVADAADLHHDSDADGLADDFRAGLAGKDANQSAATDAATLNYARNDLNASLDNRLTVNVREPSDVGRMLQEVRSQVSNLQITDAALSQNTAQPVMFGGSQYTVATASNATQNIPLGYNQLIVAAPPEQLGQLVSSLGQSPLAADTEVKFESQGEVSHTWNDSARLAMNLPRSTATENDPLAARQQAPGAGMLEQPPAKPDAAARIAGSAAQTDHVQDEDDPKRATDESGTRRERRLGPGLRDDESSRDKESLDERNALDKTKSPRRGAAVKSKQPAADDKVREKIKPTAPAASAPRDADKKQSSQPASNAAHFGRTGTPSTAPAQLNAARNAILIITVQTAPSSASQPASRNAP